MNNKRVLRKVHAFVHGSYTFFLQKHLLSSWSEICFFLLRRAFNGVFVCFSFDLPFDHCRIPFLGFYRLTVNLLSVYNTISGVFC